MCKFIPAIAVASAALLAAAPASTAPPSQRHAPGSLASLLGLRLRSIELQIDILSDRQLIGHEEANDLRRQARRLVQRLYRPSEREARDVEAAVQRLQEQLRFASADSSLGGDFSRRRDLGGFDDGERYDVDSDRDYDRGSYQRTDPRGDPFVIGEERDERGPH
jgi:hypothetical protein